MDVNLASNKWEEEMWKLLLLGFHTLLLLVSSPLSDGLLKPSVLQFPHV